MGASSRKRRSRSKYSFWISASDTCDMSRPAADRRARACAISSGLMASDWVWNWIFRELETIDVPICPGMTTEHLIWGAFTLRSVMSASVKPFTANLAAQ